MFITLEGIDGTGKSTQLPLLAEWLRSKGRKVTTCRDPGSTALGNAIREILLHATVQPVNQPAEMLLYMAARAQLVSEVIQPALQRGEDVLSDRFLLSNVVYQGHAGELPPEHVWEVGRVACGGIRPDLMLVLDMPVQQATERLQRPLDQMESRGLEFRRKLRQGFLAEAARNQQLIRVINADQPVERVQTELQRQIDSWEKGLLTND